VVAGLGALGGTYQHNRKLSLAFSSPESDELWKQSADMRHEAIERLQVLEQTIQRLADDKNALVEKNIVLASENSLLKQRNEDISWRMKKLEKKLENPT
jgi:hypothetical protein